MRYNAIMQTKRKYEKENEILAREDISRLDVKEQIPNAFSVLPSIHNLHINGFFI